MQGTHHDGQSVMCIPLRRFLVLALVSIVLFGTTLMGTSSVPAVPACFPPSPGSDRWICTHLLDVMGGSVVETERGEARVSLIANRLQIEGQMDRQGRGGAAAQTIRRVSSEPVWLMEPLVGQAATSTYSS